MNAPPPSPSQSPPKAPPPVRIVVHQQSRRLEIEYGDGAVFDLSFEFLRVNSPSAEVRGHGPGQETLQVGKRDVGITAVEPVGNYGLQPTFTDGHSTGIFSWEYLYRLGRDRQRLWDDYLARLEAAGASRDAPAGAGAAAPVVVSASASAVPASVPAAGAAPAAAAASPAATFAATAVSRPRSGS